MDLSSTYCSGLRCGKERTCARWTENLRRWCARRGVDLEGVRISVASFADPDGRCDRYTPNGTPVPPADG